MMSYADAYAAENAAETAVIAASDSGRNAGVRSPESAVRKLFFCPNASVAVRYYADLLCKRPRFGSSISNDDEYAHESKVT